ncbi:hypothetical protein [Candidatus Avelusimicrobium fimicolum]|uniref:hypothetical protein n=1 Tax=Candidatus Avelusimicrobium fimicolum TaxID=3416216 RepID=UPI003D11A45A
MGDMKEFFDAHREMTRKRREARSAKYEPMLEQAGAVWKSDGIWEYNGWFCYPSKGYAMLRKNPRVRKPLRLILKGETNDKE